MNTPIVSLLRRGEIGLMFPNGKVDVIICQNASQALMDKYLGVICVYIDTDNGSLIVYNLSGSMLVGLSAPVDHQILYLTSDQHGRVLAVCGKTQGEPVDYNYMLECDGKSYLLRKIGLAR